MREISCLESAALQKKLASVAATCAPRIYLPAVAAMVDLEQVQRLFVDPYSAALQPRQVSALLDVCRVHAAGFSVSELPLLSSILSEAFLALENCGEAFLPPYLGLLAILARPYVRSRAHE